MSEQAENLYQDALMAIEIGNPEKAIDLLKQVVEVDDSRVDAWTELAKLAEDREDKRIALTSILRLEPDNDYAKNELAAIEKTEKVVSDEDEYVPGIPRRELRLVGIGLGIYTLVICGIVFSIVSASNAQRAAKEAQVQQQYANQTATFDAINANSTQIAVGATQTADSANATLLAQFSPTPTITPTRLVSLPTVIPTETPVTPTQVTFRSELEQSPAGLGGRIYAWGGSNLSGGAYSNLLVFPLSDQGRGTRVNDDRAQFPATDTAGQSMVYMQSSAGGEGLYRINLQQPDTSGEPLNLLYVQQRVLDARYPRLSADGTKLVFVATSPEGALAVYMINFADRNTVRITSDTASYQSAAISPSGTQVIAVKNDGATTDLVAIDVGSQDAGFPQTPMTSDGNTTIEALPSYSPDGTRVVYTATTPDKPDQGDLYLLQIVGNQSAGSVPIMTVDGDDNYAVFDPTGSFIAFSSNRVGGVYNLYIYDVNSRLTYQLTADSDSTYSGSWSN